MREKDTVLEHLQHSALGAVLDDPHPLKIAEIVVQVHEPPGAILFREGGPADAIWVVCSGSLALDIQVPSRGAVPVLTLGPRDMLGWSALVGDGAMTTTATVTADAQLLRLPAGKLRTLCDSDHTLGYAVMGNLARALANRLRGTRLQLLDLYAESAPETRDDVKS